MLHLAAYIAIALRTPLIHLTPQQRAANAAAEKTIQSELQQMSASYAHKDLSGAFQYYAPNYTRTDFDGKTYRLDIDKELAKQTFSLMRSANLSVDVPHCAVIGQTAHIELLTQSSIMQDDPKKQPSPPLDFDYYEVRNQVWTRSGSRWLLLSSRTESSVMNIRQNGKIIATTYNGMPVRRYDRPQQ